MKTEWHISSRWYYTLPQLKALIAVGVGELRSTLCGSRAATINICYWADKDDYSDTVVDKWDGNIKPNCEVCWILFMEERQKFLAKYKASNNPESEENNNGRQ